MYKAKITGRCLLDSKHYDFYQAHTRAGIPDKTPGYIIVLDNSNEDMSKINGLFMLGTGFMVPEFWVPKETLIAYVKCGFIQLDNATLTSDWRISPKKGFHWKRTKLNREALVGEGKNLDYVDLAQAMRYKVYSAIEELDRWGDFWQGGTVVKMTEKPRERLIEVYGNLQSGTERPGVYKFKLKYMEALTSQTEVKRSILCEVTGQRWKQYVGHWDETMFSCGRNVIWAGGFERAMEEMESAKIQVLEMAKMSMRTQAIAIENCGMVNLLGPEENGLAWKVKEPSGKVYTVNSRALKFQIKAVQ